MLHDYFIYQFCQSTLGGGEAWIIYVLLDSPIFSLYIIFLEVQISTIIQ
jgi:hypothetical protein